MTGEHVILHGLRLPTEVDGHEDPTGQALKDMTRAQQREEAESEGGCSFPWESAALKKAVEELRQEKEGRRLDRRAMALLERTLREAQAYIASELLRNKLTRTTRTHPAIAKIDRALELAWERAGKS